MVKFLARFAHDDTGIAAVEYAVIASFMGLALLPVLPGISSSIRERLESLLAGF